MNNDAYKQLEDAKRKVLDDSMEYLDQNGVKVVASKIETHPKYGLQCTIILKAEDKK